MHIRTGNTDGHILELVVSAAASPAVAFVVIFVSAAEEISVVEAVVDKAAPTTVGEVGALLGIGEDVTLTGSVAALWEVEVMMESAETIVEEVVDAELLSVAGLERPVETEVGGGEGLVVIASVTDGAVEGVVVEVGIAVEVGSVVMSVVES